MNILSVSQDSLFFSSDNAPDLERFTLKILPKLAVINVHFQSSDNWYGQKDGLALRASLAVVLANNWMKSFEVKLSNESQTPSVRIKDPKEKCPDCHQKLLATAKLSTVKNARSGTISNCKT